MKTSFPKSKIKILLLENIHPVAEHKLQVEGFQVTMVKSALDEKQLLDVIGDYHCLGIRSKTRVTAPVLEKATKLLTVGAFCIGTDQVDGLSANRLGVPLFNAPYSNTRSVAELVIAEMISLARQIHDRSQKCHQGGWDKSATGSIEVRGKTLGIVGYGHIGSQLSILAEALGLKVLYFDVVKKLPLGNAVSVDSLADLLRVSDFVSLHVPDTSDTRGMMCADQIGMMKSGAYLINASRGKVVNIEALASALKSGALGGAAVDVFPEEPASNNDVFKSALQGLKNVILTPHIGGSTEEAQENIGKEVADSFIRFINNGSTSGAVNFPQVDLPVQRDVHRVLNVHKNVPGVLRDINKVVS
ncbi:MAG: phosphoglycerate dehydrogenase, partial [Phycisphaerales bacterium]|nr:phosphoglycerate dehydrogenase [Phycisphaerales bacterium]